MLSRAPIDAAWEIETTVQNYEVHSIGQLGVASDFAGLCALKNYPIPSPRETVSHGNLTEISNFQRISMGILSNLADGNSPYSSSVHVFILIINQLIIEHS